MNPYRTAPPREKPQPICHSCGEVATESMVCAAPPRVQHREQHRTWMAERRFDEWIERIAQ